MIDQQMQDGFAQRLREIRTAHGFQSAAAFARHLGLPASTIRRAERGQLKRVWLLVVTVCLSDLKVSSDWLIRGDPRFAPKLPS